MSLAERALSIAWNLLIERKLLLVLIVSIAIIFPLLFPVNIIAVFTIDRAILSHRDAFAITSTLDKIQGNAFVKGIVLDINSPGGTSEAIEEIYYRVLDLEKRMPVVASVNAIGASGAYYIILPSKQIFAKPSSEVGGIGVLAKLPEEIEEPGIIASGPFKIRTTKESVLEIVDMLKKNFIEVVSSNRKERLKVDPIELSSAEVYIGIKAKEMGLIDEIGSLSDAVSKTAELARLINYKVVYVNPFASEHSSPLLVESSQIQANSTTGPRFFHLYLNLGEAK